MNEVEACTEGYLVRGPLATAVSAGPASRVTSWVDVSYPIEPDLRSRAGSCILGRAEGEAQDGQSPPIEQGTLLRSALPWNC